MGNHIQTAANQLTIRALSTLSVRTKVAIIDAHVINHVTEATAIIGVVDDKRAVRNELLSFLNKFLLFGGVNIIDVVLSIQLLPNRVKRALSKPRGTLRRTIGYRWDRDDISR